MKSLHYWFLVSCVIKGVKSSLRFISNLFLSYWAKNRFAPFLTFFGLIGEYQVYREYQEFTKNTRNTHEIALLFPIFWSVTESIVPSLHFQFSNLIFSYWFFLLLGEKSLRIISELLLVVLENTKFPKNTKNLPRIPGTHMKSLY
ncbi:MAG: hypothetical protein ACK524_15700, partial [Planctomyces sp.]